MSEISVDLALNARRFQAGVRDAEGELRDLTNVLSDLGDDSRDLERKSTDALDGMADGAKDAERAIERAEREVKDLTDEIDGARREAKDLGRAGEDAGDDVRRGMDRAKDGVNDFKTEANSSAREGAASFSGEFEDVADYIQEVLANAFEGFGPIGAAAGIAAALGLGAVTAVIEANKQAQEEVNDVVSDWGQRYLETGSLIMDASQRLAAQQAITMDPEQYRKATENATNWGVSVQDAVAAMAGDMEAYEQVRATVNEREAEAEAIRAQLADGTRTATEEEARFLGEVERGAGSIDTLTQAHEMLADQVSLNDRMLRDMASTTEGATTRVDEFGDSITTLPGGVEIYVDAETGRATSNIDAIEQRIYGIPDGQANVNVRMNDRELNEYLRKNLNRTAYVNVQTRAGRQVAV